MVIMTSTHITMVADRTGSMFSIKEDAERAINAFLDEQRNVEGECSLWLIDFDSPDYDERDWFRTVFEGDLRKAPKYNLTPRGSTALYDSLARAIRQTGDKLAALREDERPERVMFLWQTDGHENASKETTLPALREMIQHQEEVYSWVFIPLGSNLGAASTNSAILYGTQSLGNVVAGAGTGHSHSVAHSHVSSTVRNLRSMGREQYDSATSAGGAAYANAAKFNEEGERVDDEGNPIVTAHFHSTS